MKHFQIFTMRQTFEIFCFFEKFLLYHRKFLQLCNHLKKNLKILREYHSEEKSLQFRFSTNYLSK